MTHTVAKTTRPDGVLARDFEAGNNWGSRHSYEWTATRNPLKLS
ncbi:hypothetical protein [Streptomyces sp. NPDC057257]